jgi:hypothetical protein
MADLPINRTLVRIDSTSNARNYTVDAESDGLNSVLGAYPRTVFTRSFPVDVAADTGAEPLFFWVYPDEIYNARRQLVRIIAVPRTFLSDDYSSYAMKYNSGGYDWTSYASASKSGLVSSVSMCGDVFEASYHFDRGDRAAADLLDGLSTFNGYTILSVSVEDAALTTLDTDDHLYCNSEDAKNGEYVTENLPDDLRSNMHEVRQFSLPLVFAWSAQGLGATPSAPGDKTGSTTTSTTYVNMLDQTVTSRTATSPGMCVDREHAATGLAVNIPCTPRTFAYATGADGYVKLIGPDHDGANEAEITVTAGTALQWWGTDSDSFNLNADAGAALGDTERNKIDVHTKVDVGGTLYVYNACAWQTYS